MSVDAQVNINNHLVPTFLYGTAWKEDSTQRCVRTALDAGFRGIDTANQRKHYYEVGVGKALLEAYDAGTVIRTDLFLQTKFTHLAGQDQRLPYDAKADLHTQVMQSYTSSLKNLHTDYLDSYVLHGPSMQSRLADQDWAAWSAMEKLCQSGKVKFLGISNVTIDQLQELCEHSAVKPSFVQNRCFARDGWNREVRKFCNENNIYYQGFSLLTANPMLVKHSQFKELVTRYKCSPEQLIFCFALHTKMIPLTGTTDSSHMREDLAAYGIKMNEQDRKLIEFIAEG